VKVVSGRGGTAEAGRLARKRKPRDNRKEETRRRRGAYIPLPPAFLGALAAFLLLDGVMAMVSSARDAAGCAWLRGFLSGKANSLAIKIQ